MQPREKKSPPKLFSPPSLLHCCCCCRFTQCQPTTMSAATTTSDTPTATTPTAPQAKRTRLASPQRTGGGDPIPSEAFKLVIEFTADARALGSLALTCKQGLELVRGLPRTRAMLLDRADSLVRRPIAIERAIAILGFKSCEICGRPCSDFRTDVFGLFVHRDKNAGCVFGVLRHQSAIDADMRGELQAVGAPSHMERSKRYFAMYPVPDAIPEYFSVRGLQEMRQRDGPLSETSIVRIKAQVAAAKAQDEADVRLIEPVVRSRTAWRYERSNAKRREAQDLLTTAAARRVVQLNEALRLRGAPDLDTVINTVGDIVAILHFDPRLPGRATPIGWSHATSILVEAYAKSRLENARKRIPDARRRDLEEAVHLRVFGGPVPDQYRQCGSVFDIWPHERWGRVATAAGYDFTPAIPTDYRVPLPPDHLSADVVQRAADAVFAVMNPEARKRHAEMVSRQRRDALWKGARSFVSKERNKLDAGKDELGARFETWFSFTALGVERFTAVKPAERFEDDVGRPGSAAAAEEAPFDADALFETHFGAYVTRVRLVVDEFLSEMEAEIRAHVGGQRDAIADELSHALRTADVQAVLFGDNQLRGDKRSSVWVDLPPAERGDDGTVSPPSEDAVAAFKATRRFPFVFHVTRAIFDAEFHERLRSVFDRLVGAKCMASPTTIDECFEMLGREDWADWIARCAAWHEGFLAGKTKCLDKWCSSERLKSCAFARCKAHCNYAWEEPNTCLCARMKSDGA